MLSKTYRNDQIQSWELLVANFLFGQVMRKTGNRTNPQVVMVELENNCNKLAVNKK
jgi:Asp-tRNA(Asn)/Glu-tRNA(Gln) amidotransferase B subunit